MIITMNSIISEYMHGNLMYIWRQVGLGGLALPILEFYLISLNCYLIKIFLEDRVFATSYNKDLSHLLCLTFEILL